MIYSNKKALRDRMDSFVHEIFNAILTFPKEEIWITVSQLKRASLSIVLNYVEGYARASFGNQRHFLKISYGSLKETEYLLKFSFQRSFIDKEKFDYLSKEADQIGALLWSEIARMNKVQK